MMADPGRLRRLWRWSRGLVALALVALVGAAVAFQPTVHWILERELTSILDARLRIERDRMFLPEGKVNRTAEGGDWALQAEIVVLPP